MFHVEHIKNKKMTNIFNTSHLIKPTKLSDPIGEYLDQTLNSILHKNEKELDGVDFRIIFSTNLPSGSYHEIKYFLPIAYDYLTNDFSDQCEMLQDWVDFIFMYNENIYQDFQLTAIDIVNHLFTFLTSSYQKIHLNKEQCQAKGWGITSYNYVQNSEMVCELLLSVSYYKKGMDWINKLVEQLQNGSDIQKQWLCELYEQSEVISNVMSDDSLLKLLDSLTIKI